MKHSEISSDNIKENVPPTYPTQSTIPTYPALARAESPDGWFQRNSKNKPQSNSAGAGAMMFISGGMFLIDQGKPEFFTHKHLALSWFLGCIIGAIIGSIICEKIHKKLITCFASLLVTISGILLIADSTSYEAMLAARYINGAALGLVFPMTMVLMGEEVVKSMRGMNAAAIGSMCLSVGIFLQIIYSYSWPEGSFDGTQMMGTLSIFWGFISFIIAFTLQIESPLFYLKRGQEELAIDALRRLQRPFNITHETYEQFEEHKRYLAVNNEMTLKESALIGLPALIKLCFYRVFSALNNSFYTFFAFAYASREAYSADDIWPYYIYGLCAWIGAMIVMFLMDSKGRKPPMIIGFFICCSVAFTLGGLLHDQTNHQNVTIMTTVVYLLGVYQFFGALSTASSSVYLTEAFPLAIKSVYVAIPFIVEMLVHITIIAVRSESWDLNVYDLPEYFYTVGALSLAFFAISIVAMPETKNDTLRECLAKFRKFINYKA
ncbi:facilitated trehalose transporter Tret1-like [Haematobia irritans]|uniref:facilitated trehalose transporter Tret1-like n=1 Tax=Haematobia irritans TaxID=7368 RepID=UPI003F506189